MIYSFRDMIPVVHPSAFIHPQATVIGHVTVGPDCYIGPGAVLRGDWGKIVLEKGCNVQEGCVLHMFPGVTVHLEEGAHIGHGAMIHGARIGKNCMVGMNAVVLDDVHLGEESIVGALSLLKAGSSWPKRSLVFGNPAAIQGKVSDDMLAHKSKAQLCINPCLLKPMNPCMKCPPLKPSQMIGLKIFQSLRRGRQGRGRHLRNQKRWDAQVDESKNSGNFPCAMMRVG